MDAALASEADALAAYSRHVLAAHRARSRQLWRRLQELAAREDMGAGARGSPASALAALAGAHARLVDADRTILGMRDGQTAPASADDTPAPVLGLAATVTPDRFRELVDAHRSGQTVTVAPAGDGPGLEGGA